MELGRVGLWTFLLDEHPASRVRELAVEVEEMGWPTLWRPESRGRDALLSSSLLLESTSRLNVATGIAIIYARHPMTTATAQKTLAEASSGRFLLGLGVSHAPSIEGIRKLSYATPYSDMKRYLEAMGEAPYSAPMPETRPMTVLAALGPRMLRLAANATDGAHPYFTPTEHTAFAREVMGQGPILAPELMVVIDDDVPRARETARRTMTRYLGSDNYARNIARFGFTEEEIRTIPDRLVDAIVACGPIGKALARTQEHLDAGADHVCVQVLVPDDDLDVTIRHWRDLADAFGLRASQS